MSNRYFGWCSRRWKNSVAPARCFSGFVQNASVLRCVTAAYGVPQHRRKTLLIAAAATGSAAARHAKAWRVWQWVAGRTAAILTPILTTGKRVVMRMKAAIDDHDPDFGL